MKSLKLMTVLTLIFWGYNSSAADMKSQVSGVQISVGDCLVAKSRVDPAMERSAIAAAIASAAISQGVNYLGKALTSAGATKTWTVTGSRNFEATNNGFPTCIQVVRGSFSPSGTEDGNWNAPEGWPQDLQAKLALKGIFLSDSPKFIFEGEVVASTDKSALTVRPIIASYMEPIGKRLFRFGRERNVALFLSITSPGTKPALDTAPAATLVLGSFSPRSTKSYHSNKSYSSPYESPWFTITKMDSLKPLTITAMLSETQDAQAFLTFIGGIFSDTKVVAALNTELGQVFIPKASEEAERDIKVKYATAANDADTKAAIAFEKLIACANVPDNTSAVTAASEARKALRNYLIADRLVEVPSSDITEEQIESIDLKGTKLNIKKSCADILASISKS